MKRKRGRPRKVDPNRKKITVEQALEMSREYWSQFGMEGHTKGTIYNLVCAEELHKEKRGKWILLFEDEVKKKLCG